MWRKLNGERLQDGMKQRQKPRDHQGAGQGNRLKVCIGSIRRCGAHIEFATVIVFKEKGGFMFIQNEQYHGQMSLKERMINEVSNR